MAVSDGTGISWTNVPGWPGIRVSADGQVRGLSGRVLKPTVADSGHLHVLIRIGGRNSPARKLRVHHAVLLAFVGPRPEGMEGRHLNDIASDNRLANLAWGTRRENADDAERNGRRQHGESKHSARLTSAQAAAIRSDPRSSRKVGHDYGVSHTTVLEIRRGESWFA